MKRTSPPSLLSFLYIGILLVMTVVGIMIFSWLLLLGAVTGLCLYALYWIRERFFPDTSRPSSRKPFVRTGRVIDHDDIDPRA